MPLIENDVTFAFLNWSDPKFKFADHIFGRIGSGLLKVSLSSVALVEMELVYRSEGREEGLLKDMAALASIPNAEFEPDYWSAERVAENPGSEHNSGRPAVDKN